MHKRLDVDDADDDNDNDEEDELAAGLSNFEAIKVDLVTALL